MLIDESAANAPANHRVAPPMIRILMTRGCTINVLPAAAAALFASCAVHRASRGCIRAWIRASRSFATAAFAESLATSGAISIGFSSNVP
jgi:hypothetical protein